LIFIQPKMNSRQRFLAALSNNLSDRTPLFKEGIRDEVIDAWRSQGLPEGMSLEELFTYDEFEEIEPDLNPLPDFRRWPTTITQLKSLRRRLDPNDPRRLPENWQEKVRLWQDRTHALILRIHRGYFLTMGVYGWERFTESISLLKDNPEFVHQVLSIQSEFAARLAEKILQDVEVDAILISEPIASTHGPLISPRMYADFVLRSYEPVLDVAHTHRVPNIILRTYANSRLLLPEIFQRRFNCLWACECNPEAMHYLHLRQEFGPSLHLIGGIDGDVLRYDQAAIQREVEDKILPLLSQGGFIPLADGRVRDDVPWKNYAFYRRLLEHVCGVSEALKS
jgi:hypothetical protein